MTELGTAITITYLCVFCCYTSLSTQHKLEALWFSNKVTP